ncbi:MAG: hypothetical protein AAGB04_11395 [Pseudomonadota bacterium]
MSITKLIAIAILSTFVFGSSDLSAGSKEFTSADFLKYPKQSQASFINASVVMASLIAGQNSDAQAKCLNAWSGAQVKSGYPAVLSAMQRFPDYHPSGVVLAVLQKQCGKLVYDK